MIWLERIWCTLRIYSYLTACRIFPADSSARECINGASVFGPRAQSAHLFVLEGWLWYKAIAFSRPVTADGWTSAALDGKCRRRPPSKTSLHGGIHSHTIKPQNSLSSFRLMCRFWELRRAVRIGFRRERVWGGATLINLWISHCRCSALLLSFSSPESPESQSQGLG